VAARWGLAARAFVYLLLGIISVSVAVGRSTSETDQWGAMQQLNHRGAGHALLWIVAIGLAGYSLWRFSEAAFGVSGEGRKAGPRLKSLVRGIVYAVLAYTAFNIVLGHSSTSQASRQEDITARIMQHSGGRLAVGLVGAIIVVVGLTLVFEGITRRFEKDLDMSGASPRTRRLVEVLGLIGTTARGAVFALAGFFVVQAAIDYKPAKAAGIDGALRALRDTAAGPLLLGVFAAGLIAFGVYGFAEARWRRT
jgi:uncharacterized membrane protein YidH (DUF202 family)